MKIQLTILTIATVIFSSCNTREKSKTMSLTTEIDSVSYSLGVTVGENLMSQGLDTLNADAFAKALNDVFNKSDYAIDREECNNLIQTFFSEIQNKSLAVNTDKGIKFLEENAKKEGVTTLPSGLQYEVLKEGSGASPELESEVTTHYHGTLIDGTVFDSSVDRGEPISFPVNGVIKGWTEALQLMNAGSKWKLYVPSDLAYGPRGAGGAIGPNETLIFEVELISFK
ncbi:MAG: FKBP-type peptidyl-prolyl cis-trans isomerase FklB [Sphingobacteriales bacterium]|jgi:FKBP-type peptidyl-prolyl cis-trans isomerase FklB